MVLKSFEDPRSGLPLYWADEVDALLSKAEVIANWHLGDTDECGKLVRDFLAELPAHLNSEGT